jgi:hypothetical protein
MTSLDSPTVPPNCLYSAEPGEQRHQDAVAVEMDTRHDAPWLHRLLIWIYTHIFSGYQRLSVDDELKRFVDIEIMVNGRPVCYRAVAIFDTGCPHNLISRDLAARFGATFSSVPGKPLLDTLGNGTFNSVGQITGRWACKQYTYKSRLGFKAKYYDGDWYVSETDEPWDVIIGLNTIKAYGLFKINRELAAAGGFRYPPRKLDRMQRRSFS